MNWLTNWIVKEGPGIRKDEPKKTGLSLFFHVIWREAWELFKLNLLMLLLAIPIVTMPASFAAGCHITLRMKQDQVVYFWRDFWRAFARLAVPATALGGLAMAVLATCLYAFYIYGQMILHDRLYVIPTVLAGCVTLFTLMGTICLFALIVKGEALSIRLFKAAGLAVLARPLPLLAALLFTAALWLAHVLFYPASVFLPVIANFSLATLAMMFGADKATDFALGLLEPARSSQVVEDPASARMPFQTEEKT